MTTSERIATWFARLSAVEMALILAVVAQTLFMLNLGQPAKLMFDETHYVPAARDLFAMTGPSNIEHPPFGKWLIGLSMALFGDTPAGWRVLSTVAGTATVLAIYAIALDLFRDIRTAATAAILTLLNQMVFIQARIAMLDIFMGAFLLAALALVIRSYQDGRPALRPLIAAGICLGLAVASKWAAIPYVAAICTGFLWVRMRTGATRWPGVSTIHGLACLGLASLATYFVTFAPTLFYARDPLTLAGLIPFQFRMLALQTQPLAPHTYMSDWWDWPLITRPIWYLYEPVDGVVRGVLMVGNPAIMWGGLIAVVACLWAGLRDKATPLLFVAGLYLFALGLWIVIPKQIGFYYYYYLPALFLSLALAGAFQHWRMRRVPAIFLAISAALFVYFFPILSAAALPDDQAFLHWMWFSTWP